MKQVLLVEDDMLLATTLISGLTEEGYRVHHVDNGLLGETVALTNDFDLMIVDWEMPGQSGQSLIRQLRAHNITTPILMLTAKADIENRIAGLDAGADDYVTKPFSYDELLARFRALLRRGEVLVDGDILELGPIRVDRARHEVQIQNNLLSLRRKEYDLLCTFLGASGRVLTRTTLAERVWGDIFEVSDNVMDVTISGLRRKMKKAMSCSALATDKPTIETVHGVGFRLTMQAA